MNHLDNLTTRRDYWANRAAHMFVSGDYRIFDWEFRVCLEKAALFQRLIDKRHRSSSTKPPVSDS